ncbi:fumarate reductase flavoprotein subunit precursor [Oxobacter pfennigii]|uniref:Urocanate reductase n=1 Tax=Oxobacter pfennigii TaxID=36849 RepID=A0A0P8WL84_9CLOT|nr:FAD-binding protein [Oxobacter pfennigii]KPU43153.1 fumarate reductase flavoprotein subunit precursor [Oxobacter pfennigii]
MKKFKSWISLLLITIMMLSFSSCTQQQGDKPGEAGEGAGQEKTYADTIKWDAAYDVVVVGFGGAGAVASVAAAEKGARVLLVEKAPEGQEGGNTRYAAQIVMAPKDRDKAITYFKALRGGYDNQSDKIIETIVDGSMAVRDWLTAHGAKKIVEFPLIEYPEAPGADGISAIVIDEQEIFTGRLWQLLRKNVTDRKDSIDVWFEAPGKELIQDPGSKIVLGVKVEKDGKILNVRAQNGVVLATGGFENNETMVENYTQMPEAFSKGAHYNTGDGIVMAMKAGADLWHMSTLSGPDLNFKDPDSVTSFGYSIQYDGHANGFNKRSTIFTGSDGTRFMNEAFFPRHGHINNSGTWVSLQIPSPAYAIFDETARLAGPIYTTWSKDSSEEIAKGWIVKADTIEELAGKVGINAEGLANQVKEYNAYCKDKKDPQFNRDAENLKAISSSGPYYAMKLVPTFTNTQGGPVRNENGEVLDLDGKPIPHLYSAGELGSYYTDVYNGGGNLAECIFSGRTSGENAAKAKDGTPKTVVENTIKSDIGAEDKIELKENEYTGKGIGMGGELTVKVAMDGKKILSVEILKHNETPNVSDKAIANIPSAIVKAQSADVDIVAGATVTSRAITEAVKDALAKVK